MTAAGAAPQRRVVFDFEIDFSNGGGLQGQDFRLDWHDAARSGEDVEDAVLAAAIVRDLRLLMVGEVRILRKTLVDEPHKRPRAERYGGRQGGVATPVGGSPGRPGQ